jgi:hypothetical protein
MGDYGTKGAGESGGQDGNFHCEPDKPAELVFVRESDKLEFREGMIVKNRTLGVSYQVVARNGVLCLRNGLWYGDFDQYKDIDKLKIRVGAKSITVIPRYEHPTPPTPDPIQYCCDELRKAEYQEYRVSFIYHCNQGWYINTGDDAEPSVEIQWCPFCGARLNSKDFQQFSKDCGSAHIGNCMRSPDHTPCNKETCPLKSEWKGVTDGTE